MWCNDEDPCPVWNNDYNTHGFPVGDNFDLVVFMVGAMGVAVTLTLTVKFIFKLIRGVK